MKINLSHSVQIMQLKETFLATVYKNVNIRHSKNKWICLTGLGVGILVGLTSIAARVGSIGESVIKGMGNILGCLFFRSCHFKTGVRQLTFNSASNLIILPFTVLNATFGLFTKTLFIFLIPDSYSYEKWCDHDPNERNKQTSRLQQQKGREAAPHAALKQEIDRQEQQFKAQAQQFKAEEVARAKSIVMSGLESQFEQLLTQKQNLEDICAKLSAEKLKIEKNDRGLTDSMKSRLSDIFNEKIQLIKQTYSNINSTFASSFSQTISLAKALGISIDVKDYETDAECRPLFDQINSLENDIRNLMTRLDQI